MKNNLLKQAEVAIKLTPQGMEANRDARANAWTRLAMMSLGLGTAAGGASIIPRLLANESGGAKEPVVPIDENIITIGKSPAVKRRLPPPPVPGQGNIAKQAEDSFVANLGSGIKNVVSQGADMIHGGLRTAGDTLKKGLIPAENSTPFGGVAGPVAALTLATIPAAVGYTGVRGMLDAVNEETQNAELEEAKEKFERAQAQQYAALMQHKNASAIDQLFEVAAEVTELTKKAGAEGIGGVLGGVANGVSQAWGGAYNAARDAAGQMFDPSTANSKGVSSPALTSSDQGFRTLLGATLAASALSGAAGGYLGYNYATDRSPEEIKKEILKRRAAALAQKPYAAVPALYATTQPLAGNV